MHFQIDNGSDHTLIVREDSDPATILPGCLHESLFADGNSYRAFLTMEQREENNVVIYGSMREYNGSQHSRIWRKKCTDIAVAEEECNLLKKAIEVRIAHHTGKDNVLWDYSTHQDLSFFLWDNHITFSPARDNFRNSSITRWKELESGITAEVRYREFERDRYIIVDCVSLDPGCITPLCHSIDIINCENASSIASRRGNEFMTTLATLYHLKN